MKLLIGVTGFALFVYLVVHIIGNLMVFLGPAAFNKYAYTLEGNPLIPIIEIGLLLIFHRARLQDGADVPREPGGAAGPLREEKVCRPAEPQDDRVLDDDRVRALAAGVHRHSRQGVPVRRRVRVARGRARSLSSRDGELRQPAHGGVLRAQHGRRRLAPVARHLELGAVARPRPSPVDAARAGRPARSSPWRSRAGSSSSRCGRTSPERTREHDQAGSADPCPVRSRRNGTATSSR